MSPNANLQALRKLWQSGKNHSRPPGQVKVTWSDQVSRPAGVQDCIRDPRGLSPSLSCLVLARGRTFGHLPYYRCLLPSAFSQTRLH